MVRLCQLHQQLGVVVCEACCGIEALDDRREKPWGIKGDSTQRADCGAVVVLPQRSEPLRAARGRYARSSTTINAARTLTRKARKSEMSSPAASSRAMPRNHATVSSIAGSSSYLRVLLSMPGVSTSHATNGAATAASLAPAPENRSMIVRMP